MKKLLEIENVAAIFIIKERTLNITYNLKEDDIVKERISYKNIVPKKICAVKGLT